MGHPGTIQHRKPFVAPYKVNYQQGSMLNTRQKNLAKSSLLLGALLSQNIHAKNPLQETGVGTRGTGSIRRKNFLSFHHFDHEEFPKTSSDIALDNGLIIKLSFEAYLENLHHFKEFLSQSPSSTHLRKWIFDNQDSLKETINNSNWSLKEYRENSKELSEKTPVISFQVKDDNYTIINIQNPEESDSEIKTNIIRALAFIIKKQGADSTVKEIEKELQKQILIPEIKLL